MMRYLLYACAIALANNVDNVAARIAFSLRGVRIGVLVNLWVSAITFAITASAAFFGGGVAASVGRQVAPLIAMVLLVCLGGWMIIEPHLKSRRTGHLPGEDAKSVGEVLLDPQRADLADAKHIDFKEATLIGIGLSINNVGGGLSAGMMKVDPVLVGLLSAVFSFIALWAGNHLSDVLVRYKLADKAAIGGGLILIAIGAEQVLH
jgi:putative sporulation protein YtaF